MKKIMITGGLGFIGSHLVRKLVKQGHRVSVIDDLSSGAAHINNLGDVGWQVDVTIDTILNYGKLKEITEGVDTIFHLATQCLVLGIDNPPLLHNVNDVGTFNVCMAAKENRCKIVYIGTSEMYGDQKRFPIKETATLRPKSLYALTKVVGEQYVRFFHDTYDVPAVLLRPFNTTGPLQREDLDMERMLLGFNAYSGVITAFMKRLEAGLPPIIFGDGKQSRDITYVDDCVDGILLLSELEDCEAVNIGYGRDYSVLEIADMMMDMWGGKRYEPIFGPKRFKDIKRLLPDITLAKRYGYFPKVSFEDGLQRYIDWYKEKRKIK